VSSFQAFSSRDRLLSLFKNSGLLPDLQALVSSGITPPGIDTSMSAPGRLQSLRPVYCYVSSKGEYAFHQLDGRLTRRAAGRAPSTESVLAEIGRSFFITSLHRLFPQSPSRVSSESAGRASFFRNVPRPPVSKRWHLDPLNTALVLVPDPWSSHGDVFQAKMPVDVLQPPSKDHSSS